MPEYRAYTVGVDGRFIGFEPLICRDDGEAVANAKRLLDGHDIEIWSGERLVIRLKSKDGSNRDGSNKDGSKP